MARGEVTEMTARGGLSEGSERFMPRPDRIETLQEAPKAKAPPGTKSPPAKPAEPAPAAVSTAPQHRRPSLRVVLMAAGIFTVIIGATLFWLRGGRYATTDDAYVQAAKVLVTTDVSGIVSLVNVREGQPVKAGDLLFQIDSLQFQIALDNAKANLHEVALTIESMKSDYQVTLSNVAAQQAQVGFDQVTFDRDAALVSSDSVARETYDQARYSLQLDKSKLVSLQQQAQVELAKLDGNPNIPVTEHPLYRQAKAQVDEAQRQLGHASVRAPFAGVVTQVDALQPGTYLVSQTAAMTETGAIALVANNQVWVTAQL